MTSVGAPVTGRGTSAYRRILVACDGSENAERALTRAIALAKENGTALIVVVVVPPSAYDKELQYGRDILANAVETAKRAVGDISGVLCDGQAADEILNIATEQNVDLVVIGRRGLSGIERFLQGGVSSAVVTHSKCDVLVVK